MKPRQVKYKVNFQSKGYGLLTFENPNQKERGSTRGGNFARKQTLNCLLLCFLSCRRPAYKD
ncbi:uncharacterized protein METZ01_LOCUS346006 [marine metagenome]|uniref:Uncharacterized protein n=1 Tax=marine metagenome TaxID=408172 RepID=A0A382R7J9_9ZZZZ